MSDNVKHPSHYTEGRKFEPKDVIRDWDLNFNMGNAVKYLARAGRKDDKIEDLRKAQQYIQFEIDAIEAEKHKEINKPTADTITYCVQTVFADADSDEGEGYTVAEIAVPKGEDPEAYLQKILKGFFGGK